MEVLCILSWEEGTNRNHSCIIISKKKDAKLPPAFLSRAKNINPSQIPKNQCPPSITFGPITGRLDPITKPSLSRQN